MQWLYCFSAISSCCLRSSRPRVSLLSSSVFTSAIVGSSMHPRASTGSMFSKLLSLVGALSFFNPMRYIFAYRWKSFFSPARTSTIFERSLSLRTWSTRIILCLSLSPVRPPFSSTSFRPLWNSRHHIQHPRDRIGRKNHIPRLSRPHHNPSDHCCRVDPLAFSWLTANCQTVFQDFLQSGSGSGM